ncbi:MULTISPECIES: transposase [unclassified Myroides]|uniref:transposase n=1 Tax=unclassified Myroides TaxID=2642485 RepID=UPI0021044241|nr:transposase [Myroides sp. NP-2]
MNTNTIIWLVLINIIFFVVFCLATKKTKFFFLFYIGGTIYLYNLFPSYKTLIYFILPNFVLGAIISLLTKKKPLVDDIFDIKIITNQGERLLENFDRGVSIFGSSGSGKTQSAIYNFFEHFKKHDFAGCLYDYKNGELTEIIMGMFDNVEIIAPHDPSISARVNFIKPELLNDEIDINEIAKVLIMNLKGNNDKGNFFDTNAEALFTGLILKFKLDHPEYCTFPHILAFLTLNDFGGIRMVRTVDEDSGEEKIVRKWSDFKLLQDFLESNHRIKNVTHQEVTINYKDYRDNSKTKELTLKNEEFTRRFSLHILPKRFVRIRHYGILSSSWKRSKLQQLQEDLNIIRPIVEPKTQHRKCYCCKIGNLVTLHVFGQRGPPKAYLIENTLASVN